MDHISQIQRLRGICKEQVEDGFREALLRANSFRQRQARLLQRRGITMYLPRFPRASPETNRSGNTGNTRLLRYSEETFFYFSQHQFLPIMKNLCFSSINKEQLLPFQKSAWEIISLSMHLQGSCKS